MVCSPGYVEWIYIVFRECVVTVREKWSFYIGLVSSMIWVICSSPQIIQNFKIKRVKGISPWFFSLILTGDITSLIGSIYTAPLITQVLTNIIYTILDGILFLQYLYYNHFLVKFCGKEEKEDSSGISLDDNSFAKEQENEPLHKIETTEENFSENLSSDFTTSISDLTSNTSDGSGLFYSSSASSSLTGGLALLSKQSSSINWAKPYQGNLLIGSIFSWIGSSIYIGSRIPQVVKNVKEKSGSDLNIFYVMLSIMGNLTYFSSLLIKSTELDYIWRQAPYITGAIGPMSFDFILLIQKYIYRKNGNKF